MTLLLLEPPLRPAYQSGCKLVREPLIFRQGGIKLEARIVWWNGPVVGLWFPKPMKEDSFIRLCRRTVG